MSAPVIHGKGRILFSDLHLQTVSLDRIREIPDGPAKDEAFIAEGARILLAHPDLDLAPMIVLWDRDDMVYWIIEGRHRRASYEAAYAITGETEVTVLIPRKITILEQS